MRIRLPKGLDVFRFSLCEVVKFPVGELPQLDLDGTGDLLIVGIDYRRRSITVVRLDRRS